MKSRPIAQSVVVVVGATSGIGKATALALASLDARLVVVARTRTDVDRVVDECRRLGATAIGVAADISRHEDVDRIVSSAIDAFGVIDTWINAAAVLIVGELHRQPVD